MYLFLVPYSIFLFTSSAFAQTNVPGFVGTIGEYGFWNTIENRAPIVDGMQGDIQAFDAGFSRSVVTVDGQLAPTFVPPEAYIGRAVIMAFNRIAIIINNSLGGFISVLLITLFAFWILLKSWELMRTGGDAKAFGREVAIKGMWIAIWFAILANNPVGLFMMLMSPIISAGALASDIILDTVAVSVGTSIPDTCAAIKGYMMARPIEGAIISPAQTADLLCVPTRMAGFLYTAVAAGLTWMWAGVGNSALTFFAGLAFVVIFIRNVYLFLIEAVGVIADLFLALMFLPFTAISECFAKKPDAKDEGIISAFFEMLSNMLGGGKFKLENQFRTFINASIYYIVLSVVAGLGLALLSSVAHVDFASITPGIQSNDFMIVLIVGALVSYLATKAGDITRDIGGKIDEYKIGEELGKNMGAMGRATRKSIGGWWKAARGK